MINPTEILTILQMNGIDKNTSLQDVKTFLEQINYSEEDKVEVIAMLKSQGWALAEGSSSVPSPVVNNVPVQNPTPVVPPAPPEPLVSPVFVPQPQTSMQPQPQPQAPMQPQPQPQTSMQPQPQPQTSMQPQPQPQASLQSQPIPQYNATVNNLPPKTGGINTIIIYVVVIIFVILLCGSISYAYTNKIGPFSLSSYTEDNLSSGLLSKISQIDSASYTISGALNVTEREAGALPFTLKVSNEKELKQKYYYDSERLNNAHDIVLELNTNAGYYSYSFSKTTAKSYPASIEHLSTSQQSTYSRRYSIVDPETGNTYQYQATEGGKNFNLTVQFATDDVIKAIKKSSYQATSTIIDGKKVTFTKNSSGYAYFGSEPPKPFLTQMSDFSRMLPPELSAKIAVSASSELKTGQMANWSFNLDAQGDFGDMTYKVNADALRMDDNYYFKINNIPSFFLFDQLAILKGKWVKVPSKAEATSSTSSSGYSPFISIQKRIPETEAKYKENRDKFVKFIKKVVTIADEEKIFIFKNKPSTETVDGRKLIKYELGFRKDKVLSFYTKVQDELKNDPELADYAKSIDQGYIDYLKSDEFSQVFDYVDNNTKFMIWTDTKGYPAAIQNVTRVVPPSEAIQLENKQMNITIRLDVSNINKPIEIKAPTDATPLDKITKDFKEASLSGDAGLKGQDDAIKSGLSAMRAQAELIYSQGSNSYGQKPFTLGPCKLTSGTLFGDSAFSKLLNSTTKDNPAVATCVSSGSIGSVSSWAVSAPLPGDDGFSWCVDSTGVSARIIDSLKGKSCK